MVKDWSILLWSFHGPVGRSVWNPSALTKVEEYYRTQHQVAIIVVVVVVVVVSTTAEQQDKTEESSMVTINIGDLSVSNPTVMTKEQRLGQVQLCLWLHLGVTTSLWICSILESGWPIFLDILVASLVMLVLISLIFGMSGSHIDHNKEEGGYFPSA